MFWVHMLFILALFIYLVMGIYVFQLNAKSRRNILFFLLCILFAFWVMDNALYAIKDKSQVIILHKIFAFSWCLYPGLILHFFLVLTKRDSIFKKKWIYALLYLPGIVFTIQEIRGELIIKDYVMASFGWQYVIDPRSIGYWAYQTYSTGCVFISLILVTSWYRKTESPNERKQAAIILICNLLSFSIAFSTDAIIPSLGVRLHPPLASVVILIWAGGVWYAIVKYRFLSLYPGLAAEDIVEYMNDLLIVVDDKGKVVLSNPRAFEILGFKPDEILSKDVGELIYEKDIFEEMQELFKKGQLGSGSQNLYLLSKDNEYIPFRIVYSTIHDKTRGFHGVLMICHDQSSEKLLQTEQSIRIETETALRDSRERLQNLYQAVEHSSSMVILMDLEGNINYVNPKFTEVLGYSFEEAQSLRVLESSPEKSGGLKNNLISELLSDKEIRGEKEFRKKDGEPFWMYYTTSPVKNNAGEVISYVVVADDVTQRKQMEDEMIRINKLDSIRILASGIGHDLNNILTAIIGNISLLKLSLKAEDPVFRFIEEAEKASFRARELGWQFLSFSKETQPSKKMISISSMIKKTVEFALHGTHIPCSFDIQEDIREIEADEGQITQVLDNLILNAVEAMPDKGSIDIVCRNVDVGEDEQFNPLKPGRYVRVSIKDEGVGIPPENLNRIFDPYFSTKKMHHGLGLTIAYSVLKKHGGHITVESKEGKGAVFSMFLPSELQIEEKK